MNYVNLSFNQILRSKIVPLNEFLKKYQVPNYIEFSEVYYRDTAPNINDIIPALEIMPLLSRAHNNYVDRIKETVREGSCGNEGPSFIAPFTEMIRFPTKWTSGTRFTANQIKKLTQMEPIKL